MIRSVSLLYGELRPVPWMIHDKTHRNDKTLSARNIPCLNGPLMFHHYLNPKRVASLRGLIREPLVKDVLFPNIPCCDWAITWYMSPNRIITEQHTPDLPYS